MKILYIIMIIIALLVGSVWLFLTFYPGVGKVPGRKMQEEYEARADYYSKGRFHNQKKVKTLVAGRDPKADRLIPEGEIPVVKSDYLPEGEDGKLFVTWLGHSSLLLQLGQKNILIDPVLSQYSSPVQFAGPKRFSQIPIEKENLPEIDILLLSHDHYDHTDRNTILAIDDKVKKYVIPLGMEAYLSGWGIEPEKIETFAWYDEESIEGIKIISTPSQHFSGRNPLKSNSTSWCGYLLQDGDHSVYYSGDGGYNEVFQDIYDRYGAMDLALIECGQYGKGWPSSHMFPEESVQAVEDLHARWSIPVHWGAFCICNNNWDDSVRRFVAEADKRELYYATPLIGERVDYDFMENYKTAWWLNVK